MSLFSFADIIFNNDSRTGGPSDLLAGKEDKYGYQILKFPSDVGTVDKGHYMVIHINQQKMTAQEYTGNEAGENPTVFQNRLKNDTQAGVDISATVGQVREVISNFVPNYTDNQQGNINLNNFSKKMARTIVRTKDTIALYMPDTLGFTYTQRYDTQSTQGLPATLLAAGESGVEAFKNSGGASGGSGSAANIAGNLSPFLANYLKNSSGDAFSNVLFTSVLGVVQNPMLEIIYSSPDLRNFRFDFFFHPRSEKEAREVQLILERLRFHHAPEIVKESNGFFLVPPSEFDIKFYYNGSINPNIPPISTCVLENIDLDYAPNGFAAYEVPGQPKPSLGATGMPVSIRMTLSFRETEYLTKASFDQTRGVVR